jgi:predicted hotdog family 3-hydroxylacyl-ACP dehydratase
MHLNRAWIESRIPHRGRMCLLEEVLDWNDAHISCRTTTHRAPDNPLRAHGRLGVACGIEYAAQAMALHGALTAAALRGGRPLQPAPPPMGILASVRDVRWFVERLDDIDADLICEATHGAAAGGAALYEFTVRAAQRRLLCGRATVVFDAAMVALDTGKVGP